MFERKIFQEMLKWKEQYALHYALFLKGARRVGKTTLAEKLGREAYESYILIRFDQADQVVKDLFVTGLRDLDVFFRTASVRVQDPVVSSKITDYFGRNSTFPTGSASSQNAFGRRTVRLLGNRIACRYDETKQRHPDSVRGVHA